MDGASTVAIMFSIVAQCCDDFQVDRLTWKDQGCRPPYGEATYSAKGIVYIEVR